MRRNKNKVTRINLPSLPNGWNTMTLEQLRVIEKISGKFSSPEAYLTNCFLELEQLKPLRYAQRWRSMLSLIPFIGRFMIETGRQVVDIHAGEGVNEKNFITWKRCYRFKGFWNALFGRRFFMEDQEILSFQQKIKFLIERENIYLVTNPVSNKKIGLRKYRSYYTNLADMPWIKYRLCCMHIQNYMDTRQRAYLDKFLSVLYVPDGRICCMIDRITGGLSPIGFSKYFTVLEINLILIFWNSTQQYYKKCFKHLFSKKGEQKTRDFMKEETEITVFLSKEIGTTPDNAQKLEAFYALQYLEDNAIQQEEKKREIDKMKRKR